MWKINSDIKKRENANDVFITPLDLSKTHIERIANKKSYTWYDPFKNSGSYYNQFPEDNNKDWGEILQGRDFFEYTPKNRHLCICSNPPYSLMDKVLERSVELKPKIISYLIGINNLTTKRMEFMEKNGYFIIDMHLTKVFKWFGMSACITWGKKKKGIISYDRKVWRDEDDKKKLK